jgi:hypothetical protein
MDIQKLFDTMSDVSRRDRSRYHLTLGSLITELEKLEYDCPVEFSDGGSPREPHSYRGYYSDLSFANGAAISAKELLAICRGSLGQTYEGYKGGDFVMGPETPLWRAPYGCCGDAIISFTATPEKVVLGTRNVD